MGYIKHNALIIEINDYDSPLFDIYAEILRAVEDCRFEVGSSARFAVSQIMKSVVNDYKFVFIAPDGSKEGWQTDEEANQFRKTLFERITSKYPKSIEVFDVRFGGDDEYASVETFSPWKD